MNLIDIVELSIYGVGCVGIILTSGVGILQGNYNLEKATKFYNEASEDIKKIIGPPNSNQIYFKSITSAPKFMWKTLKKEQMEDAYISYVAPIEKYKEIKNK